MSRRAPGAARGDEEPSQRLKRYRAKRDFAATPEPPAAGAGERRGSRQSRGRGEAPGTSIVGGQRFVIHEHHARRLHWDLRLERDGALASWALPKGLPDAPRENRFAAATEEHPIEYLHFEGEIPAGQYGAGAMRIWDHGVYECLKWEPRKVEVALYGERISGRYALFAIGEGESPKDWMVHRMDPALDSAREPMPRGLLPMLARPGRVPADERGWAYEIKWDGVRAVVYSTPGELRLESRNLNDITAAYPELRRLGRALGSRSAILDGEIVAFDGHGHPSFEALQRRMHVTAPAQIRRLAATTPVTLVIFDLLWLDGHTLMGEPYSVRREALHGLGLAGPSWQTPENVIGQGADLLALSAERGLEGILAKRLDSIYQPGARSAAWLKIKSVQRQEFVVGGFMPGKGARARRIGALLIGVHDPDGALRYAGRVGTGFSDAELDRIGALLEPLRRDSSPFCSGPRPPRGAVFCEPRIVAEVEFAMWTAAGSVRAPSYKGTREDKLPAEVVRESQPAVGAPPRGATCARAGTPAPPRRSSRARARRASALGASVLPPGTGTQAHVELDGHELKLSNLDKPMYPAGGWGKRELIDYYSAIAPVLLPHLIGRALTVTRWPDGVEGKSFFQKQAPAHRPPWVATATLPTSSKPIDYVLAGDRATLVWLANLAAIELHAPLHRAQEPDTPGALVFDLDPGAPAGVLECAAVALRLRGMLANLSIECLAKTSGSKGLQVYVPLNLPQASYARTKPFAKAVAEVMERAEPELVVSRMTKARRTGRVLIDWSQNDARKTTVCVYSLRAQPTASASTPLDWEEVAAAHETGDSGALSFHAAELLERVAARGDLFAPVLSLEQELPDT